MRRRTKKKKTEVNIGGYQGWPFGPRGWPNHPQGHGGGSATPDRPVVGHRLTLCSLCFMNNDDTLDERVIGFVLKK
jgi:hypothetical protein